MTQALFRMETQHVVLSKVRLPTLHAYQARIPASYASATLPAYRPLYHGTGKQSICILGRGNSLSAYLRSRAPSGNMEQQQHMTSTFLILQICFNG